MYPLAILLIGTGLAVLGLRLRIRRRRPADRAFTTKLLSLSFTGASALVLAVYPVLYLVYWNWMRGGPLEGNLPAGYSRDTLVGLVILGAGIAIVHAYFSFIEHLNS